MDDGMRVNPWAARMAMRCIVGFYCAIATAIVVALVLA